MGKKNKIRLVLADANEAYRKLLQEYLETCGGFEVAASVGGGVEALIAVRREQPDLLLMDLVLPGLDGLGLLDRLLEEHPAPKIAVLSQWMREEAICGALHRGASYFLGKPCDFESLAARLHDALENATELSLESAPDAEDIIDEALHDLGMSPAAAGAALAREMILMAVRKPASLRAIDRELYRPFLQEDETNTDRIEHALRYVIAETWAHGNADYQRLRFGSVPGGKSGKPSNGQFLAVMAEYVRRQMKKPRERHLP